MKTQDFNKVVNNAIDYNVDLFQEAQKERDNLGQTEEDKILNSLLGAAQLTAVVRLKLLKQLQSTLLNEETKLDEELEEELKKTKEIAVLTQKGLVFAGLGKEDILFNDLKQSMQMKKDARAKN